ncbi:MAG: hypothetical protein JWO96_434 [Candidatus Saccharibacteria bacterium]|nr:hypothetical protein [Candidatus Saccharibacteria bacterium]
MDPQAFENQPPPQKPSTPPRETAGPDYWKKPKKRWPKYVLIAILLAAIAAGVYWFALKPKPVTKTTSQNTASQTPAKAAGQIAATTKSYSSSNFYLTFSYPQDWTVTDNGGGIMTVKSPSLNLKNATGQTVEGNIILTIRDKTQKLTEFDKGNATATRASDKIAYTKPAQTQRGSTYISFLQYASTTSTGALDGVYITGDNGYQKAQAIPLVDITKVDPVISVTFLNKAGTSMSIPDSQWYDTSFSGPLKTMLESFSIT